MSDQLLLMLDRFCVVSYHAKLKFSYHRHNVSPAADGYYRRFTIITNYVYDIIGGNFETNFTLAHAELTQRHIFLSQWKLLSYEDLTWVGETFLS